MGILFAKGLRNPFHLVQGVRNSVARKLVDAADMEDELAGPQQLRPTIRL